MRRPWILLVSAWLTVALAHPGAARAQAATEAPSPPLTANAFPTSDAVEEAYSDEEERLAALAILLDLLQFKTNDKSPLALERQTDYRRTIARLDPPRAADEQRALARKLRREGEFRSAVVARFLPEYATEAERKAALIRPPPPAQGTGLLFWTEMSGTVIVLGFAAVLIARRRRARAR